MSRDFEDAENGGSALQKYFRDRQSCYIRNVPDGCRQRASAAASSVLSRGRRSTSEIPASASRVDTEIDRGCGVKQHGLAPRDLVQRVSQAKHILSLRCVAHEDITLEQSAGGLPADHWPPCGRRSSAVSPPAVCSELLRLHGFPCGGPLACCRAPRLVAYRVDEDEQDGEEDGEEESEERDGDHERRLNEKDPRKSEGQSLGYTDDALRA